MLARHAYHNPPPLSGLGPAMLKQPRVLQGGVGRRPFGLAIVFDSNFLFLKSHVCRTCAYASTEKRKKQYSFFLSTALNILPFRKITLKVSQPLAS